MAAWALVKAAGLLCVGQLLACFEAQAVAGLQTRCELSLCQ